MIRQQIEDIRKEIKNIISFKYYDTAILEKGADVLVDEFTERCVDAILAVVRKEIDECIKKLKKPFINNPIQDFNLPHENTQEYNQALSDIRAKLKQKGLI